MLLVTDMLTWQTGIAERAAWDVFVRYGGLITLGEVLNKTGSTAVFAAWIGRLTSVAGWHSSSSSSLLVLYSLACQATWQPA